VNQTQTQTPPSSPGAYFSHYLFPTVATRNFTDQVVYLVPLFHAAGLYGFFSTVVYYETPVALGLADRPLSTESVIECLENVDVQVAMVP
jgi:hypothetical protein